MYGYFGNLWQSLKIFGNLTKVFGNLWKTDEKLVISLFIYVKRTRNSCLWDGISLVFNFMFHSFTALSCEMSSLTLEEKFNIDAQPCIIVYPWYVICNDYLIHTVFHLKSCKQPQFNPFICQCKFFLIFEWLLTSFPLNHKRCKLIPGITPIRSISSPSPLPSSCIDVGNYNLSVPLNMSQFRSCVCSLAIKCVQGYMNAKNKSKHFRWEENDKKFPKTPDKNNSFPHVFF